MAFLGQTINVADIPESGGGYEPLPAGNYTVMVVGTDLKENNAKNGQYLEVEFSVQGGEHEGAKLFDRLNIQNQNEVAQKIGWAKLGDICKAVGLGQISDSNALHNKRLVAVVEVQQGKPYVKDGVEREGRPQNNIKKYLPYGASEPDKAVAQATSSGSTPPWKK